MCFADVGQKVTIYDLKVNKCPDAAKYRGNAVADLQSTSSTVVEVKLLLNNFLQLLYNILSDRMVFTNIMVLHK